MFYLLPLKLPVFCVFLIVWSTVVYDVIAYWTWAPNGWLHVMGVLDFAGGTPVVSLL
jgi:Amt family ammonium transporter